MRLIPKRTFRFLLARPARFALGVPPKFPVGLRRETIQSFFKFADRTGFFKGLERSVGHLSFFGFVEAELSPEIE